MEFDPPLIHGTLLKRYKRFMADVRLDDGSEVTAHCANTGSMLGCREPGSEVWLSPANNPKRKLKFTWELIRVGATWVGINTARPNAIVAEAITLGRIPGLDPAHTLKREVKYGHNSRIDILLTAPDGGKTYVEVKNTTLADGNQAQFPDSVTERGAKHMRELADMVAEGHKAVVVLLVHRQDCDHFSPADHIDPAYGIALRAAHQAGVRVLPMACEVSPQGVTVAGLLPVVL